MHLLFSNLVKVSNGELALYVSIMTIAGLAGIYSSYKLIADFPDNEENLEKVFLKLLQGSYKFVLDISLELLVDKCMGFLPLSIQHDI